MGALHRLPVRLPGHPRHLLLPELPAADGSSAWYLRPDYRITCYDAKHRRYIAAGTFWIILYICGIPLFFLGLLWYYKARVQQHALQRNARSPG